jgi:aminobenzoyl-glutamate utilization protein A
MVREYEKEAVQWRRDLHRLPQPAWLEFYATGLIAQKLAGWGYDVKLGRDVIAEDRQLLRPSEEKLRQEYDRALAAGTPEQFIAPAKGGFTGVVGILEGAQPGPTVAFRVDIDSNDVGESAESSHRPVREGFASGVSGYTHACGHDSHVAMGLLLARHLASRREKIRGRIKLIFQPNEENFSGAAAMVAKGHLDDVDYLIGGHVGVALREAGKIAIDTRSWLAVTRSQVTFTGLPSHAGLRPDLGKNALLGACTAVTNLYAIARHGLGPSRINVGLIQGGSAWNVIPEKTHFWMETRAIENAINDYMQAKAADVLAGAARMYDLELEVKPAARCPSGSNSPELVKLGVAAAGTLPWVKEVVPELDWFGSDDFMTMADVVQRNGGQSLYVLHGTPTGGGHHSPTFDIDEAVIGNGAEFYAALYEAIVNGG